MNSRSCLTICNSFVVNEHRETLKRNIHVFVKGQYSDFAFSKYES